MINGDNSGDQAGTLRKLMSNRVAIRSTSMRPVRVISVTSGKGGVGKTNLVANLAVQLQKQGHRVLVLDGDFGLANLNIVMGLNSKHTLFDVLTGEKEINDVILNGPHGVKVMPASSGIFKMTQLSMSEKSMVMESLEQAPFSFDILLIDTGAGINSDVAYLNAAASEVVVVTTPEPTSIADAYALMKVLSQENKIKRFRLVVNRVSASKEALAVYENLLNVSDRFLNIHIDFLGFIVDDKKVSQAVMSRKVLSDFAPDSAASRCFNQLARSLSETPTQNKITGNVQYFWRTLLSEVNL